MRKRLLIAGDSFASDWTVKFPEIKGWPNLLSDSYQVHNVAQAGCGEYKIYKQLNNAELNLYDAIIVSHTSPYRLHTTYHPIHNADLLHSNSDFIYSDCKEHNLVDVVNFFEQYSDLEYYKFVHELICQKIIHITSTCPVLHITHTDWNDFYQIPKLVNFNKVHKSHSGFCNHYNELGNKMVYQILLSKLDKI